MLGIWNSSQLPSLHAFTREKRGKWNRSRGRPVVNRETSRATLWGRHGAVSKQNRTRGNSMAHCSRFSRLSAHRGEGRARYGCHVAETRQARRSRGAVTQFHIRPKCIPSSPTFSFVRTRWTIEFAFLPAITAFPCCSINSNEFLSSEEIPRMFRSRLKFSMLFEYFRDTWRVFSFLFPGNNFNVTHSRVLVFLRGCPTAYRFTLLRPAMLLNYFLAYRVLRVIFIPIPEFTFKI